VQNAVHSTEEADERGGRTDGRQTRQAAPKLCRLNGDGALQSALAGLDFVARNLVRLLVGTKFLKAGINDHRQVRLAMLVADVDGLFNALVLERLGDARRKFARLLLGSTISEKALDRDGYRMVTVNPSKGYLKH
jgi:hypothetical protein